jgi:hypothetical protein
MNPAAPVTRTFMRSNVADPGAPDHRGPDQSAIRKPEPPGIGARPCQDETPTPASADACTGPASTFGAAHPGGSYLAQLYRRQRPKVLDGAGNFPTLTRASPVRREQRTANQHHQQQHERETMSFWDIIWFIIVSFAFIAYLMILFNILGDLFRDKSVSGGVKAVWVVCLIFFPLITALVYLITRGGGMAERSAAAVGQMQEAQDAYIKSVAGTSSPADQIAQARALLDAGSINQEEYEALKAKALA